MMKNNTRPNYLRPEGFKPDTPSQQAKAAGLKNLTQVSEMLGTKPDGNPVVSLQTLGNWHKHKPKLFAVVLAGCKAINDQQDAPECLVKCNHDHCWKHLHMTGGYHLPGCQVRKWQDEQADQLVEQLLKSTTEKRIDYGRYNRDSLD